MFKFILVFLVILLPTLASAATRTAIMKQEEAQTERSVQLRASDPGSPVTSQLWVNTAEGTFKRYTGSVNQKLGLTQGTTAISASSIDWSTASAFTKTLSANTTFTFTGQLSGQVIIVRLTNTASNYTVTWPVSVLWSGGTPPVQTIGAFSDVLTFFYDGTTVYGSSVQNF